MEFRNHVSNGHAVQEGFTLVELMITISIAIILLSIAVPGFQAMAKRNQVRNTAVEFYSLLNLARSEAVSRNRTITLCRSLDPFPNSGDPACGGSGALVTGWIVFEDDDADGAFDGGEAVLRGFEVDAQSLRATSGDFSNFVSYQASGRPSASGTINICDTDLSVPGRTLTISPAGSVSIKELTCT